MFTRKKKVIAFFIYILSFSILFGYFGEGGVLENNELKREREALEAENRELSAAIRLLREEEERKREYTPREGELIYTFSETVSAIPVEEVEAEKASHYTPLSNFSIFLLSFIPSFIYILITVILSIRRERNYDKDNQLHDE